MNGKRILITAIGSMAAEAVIISLVNSGYEVIGCDIYPREYHPIATKLFDFVQVPKFNEKNYAVFMRDTIISKKIDYFIPLTDPEIDVLNQNRKIFGKDVTLCFPTADALSIIRNKLSYQDFFAQTSFFKNIPSFRSLDEGYDILSKGKIVAKKINGRSSEGLQFFQSIEKIGKSHLDVNNIYMYQPVINGEIYTVDFIRDKQGNTFSISRQELVRTSNGAGTVVRIKNIEKINKSVNYIGQKLNIIGCINFEFIKSDDDYYLMDINPRFSAGVAFSVLAGYDYPLNHLKCFLGECIDVPQNIIPFDKIMVKRYIDFCPVI